jgi:hypothetical protein
MSGQSGNRKERLEPGKVKAQVKKNPLLLMDSISTMEIPLASSLILLII